MPESIRITYLQVIYLLMDIGDAIKVLKENQTLIQFINDSIASILEDKI